MTGDPLNLVWLVGAALIVTLGASWLQSQSHRRKFERIERRGP